MADSRYFTEEFKQSIIRAGAQARLETLQAGVPVFYWDNNIKKEVMENPNGQRFEIRYIPGAPGDENHEILGEIVEPAS